MHVIVDWVVVARDEYSVYRQGLGDVYNLDTNTAGPPVSADFPSVGIRLHAAPLHGPLSTPPMDGAIHAIIAAQGTSDAAACPTTRIPGMGDVAGFLLLDHLVHTTYVHPQKKSTPSAAPPNFGLDISPLKEFRMQGEGDQVVDGLFDIEVPVYAYQNSIDRILSCLRRGDIDADEEDPRLR